MKVLWGSERCVLAFPKLGFVLKFPGLHRASWVWGPHWKEETLRWKMLKWLSQAYFFGRGAVAQNRRERKTWGALHDSFLAPTYFCFFGLVNIQRYYRSAQGTELGHKLSSQIREVFRSDRNVVAVDAHSWFQIANYSVQPGGVLCKLDYGGENDLEVLRRFLPILKQMKID
ncbi:MAG: hypothetical protein B7X03_00765 [Parcubacteria group bacterium 21-58-10]|nr:MAG: hypothetical protein B7X03_00765 [Parcubacteria group bacterium 21-58-10]